MQAAHCPRAALSCVASLSPPPAWWSLHFLFSASSALASPKPVSSAVLPQGHAANSRAFMRHTRQQSHALFSIYLPDVKRGVFSAETQMGVLASNSPSACCLFQTWNTWKHPWRTGTGVLTFLQTRTVRPGSKEGANVNSRGRISTLPITGDRAERGYALHAHRNGRTRL